jgi:hypothetical protein
MTFKEMIDRVKYTLGAEESVYNDEIKLIKDFLNEGLVNVLVRTRPYTRVITLNLTAQTPVYDMSNQILALVDVEMPGHGFLKRHTREDISLMQLSGHAGFAYEEPLLWLSPVTAEDEQTIQAYGIFRPTEMFDDGNDPSLPAYGGLAPEFHEAVILYTLWKMGEYVQHAGSGEGERWRMQYEGQDGTEGEIARIKRIIQKRVTPAPLRRRNLARNVGILSDSGEYIGATR